MHCEYLRKCFLVGKIFYEVTPLFHESMGRTNLAKVRFSHEAMRGKNNYRSTLHTC